MLTVSILKLQQRRICTNYSNCTNPLRNLHSSTQNLFVIDHVCTAVGERSLKDSAAIIWNNLPAVLRNYLEPDLTIEILRCRLKVYLIATTFYVA